MPKQIEIADELHDALASLAAAVDITPEHLVSRLLFGGVKKAQMTPQQRAAINAAHAKATAASPPPQ